MKIKSFLPWLCIFGFVGTCLWSCERVQSYPCVPDICFLSLTFEDITTPLGIDKMAMLTFSFIDGGGNIGVRFNDSISKIHFTWDKKMPDGGYEHYQFPNTGTINDSIAIPYNNVMNKDEAQNKTLQGTIRVALVPPNISQEQKIDTMRIEFYIFDRAKNQSNIEYTPDFSILDLP